MPTPTAPTAPISVDQFAKLAALGFRPAGAPPSANGKRRAFITSEGPPATGKTDFIRRMRPPIVAMDLDRGMEGVAEFDIWGNPILQHKFELPDLDEFSKSASTAERDIAKRTYAEFKSIMERTFKSGAAGTIVVDTGGAAYALAQIARFGQIAQLGEVPAAMWTSMQAEYAQIFLQYADYGTNLYVTHRQGAKFKGLTGEMEMKGYKEMQYLSQIHLAFAKRAVLDPRTNLPVKDAATGRPEIELVRRAVKCRQRLSLEGAEFPVTFLDDDKTESVGGDFATIMQAVFPSTTEEDWI